MQINITDILACIGSIVVVYWFCRLALWLWEQAEGIDGDLRRLK